MATRVLVVYYSLHGHVETLARSVAGGAESVRNTEVRLRRVPDIGDARPIERSVVEATHDDVRWADGIAWGTPTRFGNMSAQMKQFLDSTGPLWQRGELEDKPAGVFTSTASIQGGHETTIVSAMLPLLHLGMIVLGTPYGQNPQILTATETIGSSPYGPGTIAGMDGSLEPKPADLQTARNLGARIARFAMAVKWLCAEGPHGLQAEVKAYRAA
jgi:NAD(P)H dehydrogenase (quinone)